MPPHSLEPRKKRLLDRLPKLLPVCLYEVLSVEETLFYVQTGEEDGTGIATMAEAPRTMVLMPDFFGPNKITPMERRS